MMLHGEPNGPVPEKSQLNEQNEMQKRERDCARLLGKQALLKRMMPSSDSGGRKEHQTRLTLCPRSLIYPISVCGVMTTEEIRAYFTQCIYLLSIFTFFITVLAC